MTHCIISLHNSFFGGFLCITNKFPLFICFQSTDGSKLKTEADLCFYQSPSCPRHVHDMSTPCPRHDMSITCVTHSQRKWFFFFLPVWPVTLTNCFFFSPRSTYSRRPLLQNLYMCSQMGPSVNTHRRVLGALTVRLESYFQPSSAKHKRDSSPVWNSAVNKRRENVKEQETL